MCVNKYKHQYSEDSEHKGNVRKDMVTYILYCAGMKTLTSGSIDLYFKCKYRKAMTCKLISIFWELGAWTKTLTLCNMLIPTSDFENTKLTWGWIE